MSAYSKNQMQNLDIRFDEYKTNPNEGIFYAKLDCKCWGKKCNILAYFTMEDGSKCMASAWQNTDYLGIPDIEEGANLKLTFKKAKNGLSYLREVEQID